MVSKVKQIILSVSISIILALFIGYGISTFYSSPEIKDFCDYSKHKGTVETEEKCLSLGGEWNIYGDLASDKITASKGWCNLYSKCEKTFREAKELYNRNVFLLCSFIGLISLLVGGIVLKLESVSTGIMGGGSIIILYGIIRYWGDAPDFLRFLILGVILGFLIWIGYKKLNPNKSSSNKY